MNKQMAATVAVGSVLVAAALGARNGPQRPMTALWYAALRKPAFTPPGPVVGAAWGTLELLLAGAGYRLLQAPRKEARSAAIGSWALTLVGLAGYPWLFFRKKQLGSSAVASGSMLAAAVGTATAARDVDRPAAVMTLPLLAWLSFATLLSEELWRRN